MAIHGLVTVNEKRVKIKPLFIDFPISIAVTFQINKSNRNYIKNSLLVLGVSGIRHPSTI